MGYYTRAPYFRKLPYAFPPGSSQLTPPKPKQPRVPEAGYAGLVALGFVSNVIYDTVYVVQIKKLIRTCRYTCTYIYIYIYTTYIQA